MAKSFFCSIEEKQIVVLHSIIKKSMNAPKTDMDLVVKRMKEVKIG
ncbi:type II toxin-antitoxin system RelE/ParE family toxin [Desulfocicer niacini]